MNENFSKEIDDLEIIFENDDFLVLNKPAGLMTHSDGKSGEKTLCDLVIEKYPEISGVGEPLTISGGTVIEKPGIVHRLDRETSGTIVIAKNQKAFEYLKSQFQDRKVEKTYHAFVYGNIKEDSGVIDKPIGRSRSNFKQWSASSNVRGELREAVTEFEVLKRSEDKKTTLVEARPKTGRTHQIRVHFKYLYHPVIADSLYAPNMEPLLGFERLALHSRKIAFQGINGELIEVTADYPADFQKALDSFKTL